VSGKTLQDDAERCRRAGDYVERRAEGRHSSICASEETHGKAGRGAIRLQLLAQSVNRSRAVPVSVY